MSVFDGEGRFNPAFDEEVKQLVETGSVIISVGQAPDVSFLSKDSQLEMALWRGSLQVDENTLSTNIPGVFAGGDFTTGPTFVIRAIASGRRAALAIHRHLQGEKGRLKIMDEKSPLHVDQGLALEEETTEEKPRAKLAGKSRRNGPAIFVRWKKASARTRRGMWPKGASGAILREP